MSHVHPLLGNVLVKSSREDRFLVNSPLLGYASIFLYVFSMLSAPSNSRNGVLSDQLLGYATVLNNRICFLCGSCRVYITR
jgi:hypothetical protein